MLGLDASFQQIVVGLGWTIAEAIGVELGDSVLEAFRVRPVSALLDLISKLPRRSVLIIDETDMIYSHSCSKLLIDLFASLPSLPGYSEARYSCIFSGVPFGDPPFPGLSEPPTTISLVHFNRLQTRLFFELCRLPVSDGDLDQIFELTGGHPYLLAVTAKQLSSGTPLNDIVVNASAVEGPFSTHMAWAARLLETHHLLREGLRDFMRGKKPRQSTARELLQLGLLQERNGQLELACSFYRDAFFPARKGRWWRQRW